MQIDILRYHAVKSSIYIQLVLISNTLGWIRVHTDVCVCVCCDESVSSRFWALSKLWCLSQPDGPWLCGARAGCASSVFVTDVQPGVERVVKGYKTLWHVDSWSSHNSRSLSCGHDVIMTGSVDGYAALPRARLIFKWKGKGLVSVTTVSVSLWLYVCGFIPRCVFSASSSGLITEPFHSATELCFQLTSHHSTGSWERSRVCVYTGTLILRFSRYCCVRQTSPASTLSA